MHEMPRELLTAAEAYAGKFDRADLIASGRRLSERYRSQRGEKRRLMDEKEVAAYSIARMPATFAAAHAALSEGLSGISVHSHLDCGSGTGAVAMAAWTLFHPELLIYQECEPEMAKTGLYLLNQLPYESIDSLSGNLTEIELPHADLVTEGYVLGELNEEQRKRVIEKLWRATDQALVLIEPGTPEGSAMLQEARKQLKDATVTAPCICSICPLQSPDWCHFSVRVPRTQLHKQIKGGDAPYEDEKFSYMVFVKNQISEMDLQAGRVLRHPQIAPGRIQMTLCTRAGVQEKTITKKDLLWKQARKANCGDQVSPVS